ncbi:insulinase family protein [Desulfonatronovibrio hydrogenovorans]|uniref:insulinase family protein n=1 Tax=Desulfonatronovibrio hydrogenovorans TaxID=53245 RepID=UPI00048CD6A0|nr:insulinase family protein [Desulfonatronovibrio hydrogenovorans]
MSYLDKYTLIEERDISEINSRARLFEHKKTGARVLSLTNQDENKVFSINFRTPPKDNTGVPHILEHSVLCGSRKYKVKEPFVELLKSSLQTFLNAVTFPDKTCYPVASQNLQDFYNLMDVYLDSVFFPRITRHIFEQEGWHYELENLDSPLKYKGVVFNEMKGAYSSPDSLLADYSQQSIFPDSTYGFDAGGDPQAIPDLTYDDFVDFHKKLYHPSNAFIFFYGDNPEQERLEKLAEYLDQFSRMDADSSIVPQQKKNLNQRLVKTYSASADSSSKTYLTINWLLPETHDPELNLSLRILDFILTGMPASPLRKALIDSGLGEDLTGAGLETDILQMYYSTGLKGIEPANLGKVEKLINSTLDQLAAQGIDPEIITAAINSLEFALRENNTGSFPRGLAVMFRALTTWLYDHSPFILLEFSRTLDGIKSKINTGEKVFEQLIRKYLLDNTHRSVVILEPDPGLGAVIQEKEDLRLQEVRLRLSQEDLQDIVQNTAELKQAQARPDDPAELARIPRLKRADLEKELRITPKQEGEAEGVRFLFHPQPTAGIFYLDLGFDLHFLPREYLAYVPLFGRALLEMGTARHDFVRMTTRIRQKTGGISPVTFTHTRMGGQDGVCYLFLRGKSLPENTSELFHIIKEIIADVDLDNRERFRQIVLEEKAGMEQSLIPAGHRFVGMRLKAGSSEADWAQEQMSGISYLLFLRKLTARIDSDWDQVLRELKEIRRLLFHKKALLANLTAEQESFQSNLELFKGFAENLPQLDLASSSWVTAWPSSREAIIIPAQVNYVGKSINLEQTGYTFHGSSLVATRLLRAGWLWDQVRVQGGAYGAFGSYDHLSGVMAFASYRDPNILDTLKAFDGSGTFLMSEGMDGDEVEKAVIGAIGEMDSYQLPDARGFSSTARHLAGITQEYRQAIRDQILSSTLDHFKEFGRALDKGLKNSPDMICIMGGEAQVDKAAEELNLENRFRLL